MRHLAALAALVVLLVALATPATAYDGVIGKEPYHLVE